MSLDYFGASDSYERFMGRWSAGLAHEFMRFAQVAGDQVVLDVGCGTGALGAAIARAAPTARVVGVDRSRAYVAAASRRLVGLTHFAVGDACTLPFRARSFDRAVSLLALNFVPTPDAALDEMRRVTRPGGMIAAAVWDYSAEMEMLRLFWDEAVALAPSADSRDERHMPLCRQGELASLWQTRELADPQEQELRVSLRFASFEDFWQPFLRGQGPAGAYAVSLPDGQRHELRARLRHRLLGRGADRPFALSARAWAVRGLRS